MTLHDKVKTGPLYGAGVMKPTSLPPGMPMPAAKPMTLHDKVKTGPIYGTGVMKPTQRTGPPATVPAINPNRPQPVPLQAAQINGYLRPEQFRGAHSNAMEFGSPMKNFLFNYGMPLADMGLKMFNLPGILPTARAPFRSTDMMRQPPRSNAEILAGMGVR